MPALPDGDPAPADGALPGGLDWARPLRAYVHVPFCAARCGYCDFNTYTPSELGGFDADGYVAAVRAEIELAARVTRPRPLASVFIGGGTPSLLPAVQLRTILDALRDAFGVESGAEITMEANPENVNPDALDQWLGAGVTRLSVGMQSADADALRVLQRVHTPGAAVAAARAARSAGFEHVSLDLIYGIPGQTDASWEATLAAALDAGPDHVSAYALGVEPGTALYRDVQRGVTPAVDPDAAATQYELADQTLGAAGLGWYEISNWALPGGRCEHNVGYWRADNWWGFGPGAHSHVDGVRWWNVKRPATYQSMLSAGVSPAAGREVLDARARATEAAMLQVRLAEGFTCPQALAGDLVAEGLAEPVRTGLLRLSLRGRMLADAVTRRLLGWD